MEAPTGQVNDHARTPPMTRLPFLAGLMVAATLIVAPNASAKPIGTVRPSGDAAAVHASSHEPKSRCVHNGASTNKAGHLNCRRTKTGAPTGTGDSSAGSRSPTTPNVSASGIL